MESRPEGKSVVGKGDRSRDGIFKQSPFKNLGEFHTESAEAAGRASRAPVHRRVQEVGYKPLLNQERRQKHHTSAEDFEIKVPESGGGVERHRIQAATSPE